MANKRIKDLTATTVADVADVVPIDSVTTRKITLLNLPISTLTQTELNAKIASTRTIVAGAGLTGGGDLSADRTLALATIAASTVLANPSGAAATPAATTVSALLDATVGNAQGSILVRKAAGWDDLAPGTAGLFLKSNGAGADPSYATPVVGAARVFHGADYGVVGNGSTDDTTKINELIYAVYAAGGGIAQLAYGDHKISGQINLLNGVTLQGMGWGPGWDTLNSVNYPTRYGVAKYGTRLSWYGTVSSTPPPQMVSFGVIGLNTPVTGAALKHIDLDGRMTGSLTVNMVRGVRFCGSIDNAIENVSIKNVGQAVAVVADPTTYGTAPYQYALLCVENTFTHIRIFKAHTGFYFEGAGSDFTIFGAAANSTGHDIIIWFPTYAGFEFYQWCDNNRFDNVFVQGGDTNAFGILVNPANVVDNGCSVITFSDTIITKPGGGSGKALVVGNTNGTPFSFGGNIIGETQINYNNGAIVYMTNKGFPTNSISWLPIVAGSPIAGNPANAYNYISSGPASAYFSISDYCFGDAWAGYTLADKVFITAQNIQKVIWYTHWHTGSTSGGIALLDPDNANAQMGVHVPGVVESNQFSEIDVTSYILNIAPGGNGAASWLFQLNRRAGLAAKGDGTTAATIYKSFLKIYFNPQG